jgi:hypothetical protein
VLFAYRTSIHSASSPIDIIESNLKDIYHDVKNYGMLLTREMKRAHEIVKQRLLENAKKMSRDWNDQHLSRRVSSFSPGDHVLMFKPTLNKQTGFPDHSAKFNRSWHGPYLVKEHRFEANSDVYLLEDTETGRQWSVNVNKLTRYFPRTFLSKESNDVPAVQTDEQTIVRRNRGGATQLTPIEPTCDGVVTRHLGGRTSVEALLDVGPVIPTATQNTTAGLGVTRNTPISAVSHEVPDVVSTSNVRSDRIRISKQELAREAKRSRLAEESTCSYSDRLKSHEFVKILGHGQKARRYYYVVEWADKRFEPSNVWTKDVETTEAVELYWKSIPKGSRPRMFRKYPYVAASTDPRTMDTKMSDGSVDETVCNHGSQHQRIPTIKARSGTREVLRPRVRFASMVTAIPPHTTSIVSNRRT